MSFAMRINDRGKATPFELINFCIFYIAGVAYGTYENLSQPFLKL